MPHTRMLLVILAALSPAAFADWVAINGSKNFFYYPKSLKTQGKFAKIWGMVNYDEVAISNVLPKSKKVFLDTAFAQEAKKKNNPIKLHLLEKKKPLVVD